ncbi:hypothetical protein [Streptomyces sp. NPDC026673]|uniref:hypothetical protein n=1 Tax=Streptomyces sp. NPDC026673 TaxID=3155724 RepID=UPI0033FC7B3D
MSSPVTPKRRSGEVVPDGRTPSGVDRVIKGMAWWWMASPLILLTPLITLIAGFPEVREEFGRVFGLAALTSAVVAPATGFLVALVGRRRQARRRFAVMGAVSGVPVLFFLVFGVLFAECPDGYHC